jgi:hypothetical protein
MTKWHKQWNINELNRELADIVKQYSSGLLTDVELLQNCQLLQEQYAQVDLSELCDPNTGLRHPKGYKPFATNKESV